MAKKLTKLQRSNNAHWKLRQRAADVPGKRGDLLYSYHGEVLRRQSSRKRVLSRSERRGLFSRLSNRGKT